MNPIAPQKEIRTAQNATPTGPACAAILAAAIGCLALGILAVLGDASKAIASKLTFYRPTGPLSGVTSLAILAWLLAWVILAALWRNKTVRLGRTLAASFIFLALGLLLTFPPFADLLMGR